ncbi:MAG: T9SS type A sorting domain-containing protein, partial [Lentimicrobium sp.]|nr:T9SS type A sorting domain-containing protein [Lentimicrobium sp.]
TSGLDAVFVDDIFFPSGNAGGSGTELTANAFAHPSQMCIGGTAKLFAFATNASGDVTYVWTPAEVLNNAQVYNPVATLTETTTFDLTVNYLMNSASTQVTVEVIPLPETPVIEQNLNQLISSATEGNQWYNREGPIEGAVDQIFEPLVSDFYHVMVSSAAGCDSEPSNEIYMTVVGVENLTAENSLTIYPNPFRTDLHISYNLEKNGPVRISLLNLLGQETVLLADYQQIQAGSHSITVTPANLKAGIYFIRLQSGDFTTVRKIVLSE